MPSRSIINLGDSTGVVCRPGSFSFSLFFSASCLPLRGDDSGDECGSDGGRNGDRAAVEERMMEMVVWFPAAVRERDGNDAALPRWMMLW